MQYFTLMFFRCVRQGLVFVGRGSVHERLELCTRFVTFGKHICEDCGVFCVWALVCVVLVVLGVNCSAVGVLPWVVDVLFEEACFGVRVAVVSVVGSVTSTARCGWCRLCVLVVLGCVSVVGGGVVGCI